MFIAYSSHYYLLMIPFVPNPPTPLPAQDLKYTNYLQFHPLVSYLVRHPDIGKHFKSFSNERPLRQIPGPEFCQRLASIIV